MKNLKETKELIKKVTGCDKVMKEKDTYIIFFKNKNIKSTNGKYHYDYKKLNKEDIRDIYITELGI